MEYSHIAGMIGAENAAKTSGITGGGKNIVFIGESGCGKTEASMDFAIALSKSGVAVHFFDMDQTKPLFRARDSASVMESFGVSVHYQQQPQDLPVMVPAVREILADRQAHMVMDVGGSDRGARMIGQFSGLINSDATTAIFVINPYRPWTNDPAGVADAISRVTGGSRIKKVKIACNPALGFETTAQEAVAGSKTLAGFLGKPPDFTFVREELVGEVASQLPEPVLPIHIYIRYPWQV